MRIKYRVPATNDMSPCTLIGTKHTMETAHENALWEYNRMRDHDGLPPLKRLPAGTTSEMLEE